MSEDNSDSGGESGSPVDWEVARTLTGGDDELLEELIALFPEESARHLEAIRTAIEQRDEVSLTRAAHTLKSSARLFGATSLAASALELETLGQSSDIRKRRHFCRIWTLRRSG